MRLADRIVADPETSSGHPRVEGTRIRVAHVLEWLAGGMSEADVVVEYPSLTAADVRACLTYAAALVERDAIAAE